jgi:hypothetical protein
MSAPSHFLRRVAAWPFLFLATISMLSGAVHVVEPGPAERVSEAISRAKPGDVVQLRPGLYTGTVEVTVSGEPERPIIVSGLEPGAGVKAVIDAGGEPGMRQNHQAFRLKQASWIILQDIEIRNAWTDVITLENSSYVSLLRADVVGCGQHVVLTRGADTHHVLIEDCTWTQDERVYTTWDWDELHHGTLKHYNGGIYGGNGAGGAVVRRNNVGYVFNGLRWWLNKNDAATRRLQSNIEIYENHFHHCRDNVVEPEMFTWNLHLYHNRLDSCPQGPVSIDGVAGGEIYFYGNTGHFSADGYKLKNDEGERRAWTVYKFHNYGQKAALDAPLHLYNNSWAYHHAFAPGARTRKANDHVLHFNNAYLHLDGRGDLGLVGWAGQHGRFDHDVSSRPFPADVVAAGFEQNGIDAADPRFVAPADADFRLEPGSPAIDAGKVIEGFTLWYVGEAPDAGAREAGMPVYGTPFVHRDPPGGSPYVERPRIVRVFARDASLVFFFSAPLDPATLTKDTLSLRLAPDGPDLEIRDIRFPVAEHNEAVVVELAAPPPGDASELIPEFGVWPTGMNGQPATLWAADTRIVRVPADATLAGLLKRLLTEPEATSAGER